MHTLVVLFHVDFIRFEHICLDPLFTKELNQMCIRARHYNGVRYALLQHHDWTPLHPNNEET